MRLKVNLLLAALVTSTTGCAAMNQMYAAQAASSAVALRATQDNVVDTLKFSICAVPYGTVVRREDFQEIARAACLPKNSIDKSTLLPEEKK
jgi:hypothetical protein